MQGQGGRDSTSRTPSLARNHQLQMHTSPSRQAETSILQLSLAAYAAMPAFSNDYRVLLTHFLFSCIDTPLFLSFFRYFLLFCFDLKKSKCVRTIGQDFSFPRTESKGQNSEFSAGSTALVWGLLIFSAGLGIAFLHGITFWGSLASSRPAPLAGGRPGWATAGWRSTFTLLGRYGKNWGTRERLDVMQ